MTPTATLLLIYCGLVVAASVTGGQLSQIIRLTHLRTQLLMSGVGGLMIGIALLHLLPQASVALGSPAKMGSGALIGLIAMFLLIRLFPTHDHTNPDNRPRATMIVTTIWTNTIITTNLLEESRGWACSSD